jgi:hypothetical protein
MTRAFGLIAILIAMYLGMSIYTDGIDRTLGGIFASVEPVEDGEEQSADSPSAPSRPRERVTERVRDRVTVDLQQGLERRGYDTD